MTCNDFLDTKRKLWNLWVLSQAYGGKPPSEILMAPFGVTAWASQKQGTMDVWTAYQLNQAIATVGRYIENKLAERDDKGVPLTTLEKLLSTREERQKQNKRPSVHFADDRDVAVVKVAAKSNVIAWPTRKSA